MASILKQSDFYFTFQVNFETCNITNIFRFWLHTPNWNLALLLHN